MRIVKEMSGSAPVEESTALFQMYNLYYPDECWNSVGVQSFIPKLRKELYQK